MKEFKLIINCAEEMVIFGEKLGKELKPNMLITLEGDLGAGKTTMTKGIAKGLGVKDIVNSPTFTIMKIYEGDLTLYHMDVYRLDNNSGDEYLEEYFYMDGVSVVEWAGNMSDIIPEERLEINIFNIDQNTREIVITPKGNKYIELIERVFKNE